MNTDTPRTNEALAAILERDGELSEKNAPEVLVKLCRAMECKAEELNHQLARSQEDDDLLVIAWMHGAESNRRQCRDLARECDRLRDALRAIIGCGLNCKDALDEAEQMERIAKEALSPENAKAMASADEKTTPKQTTL
jgi:hypothetical protein